MAIADSEARAAANAFGLQLESMESQIGGHINASWRIATPSGESWLLQRLNPEVFPDGAAVMRNVALTTAYLSTQVSHLPDAGRRALRIMTRPDGTTAWQAPDGAWWRVLHFIDRSRTCLQVTMTREAQEVGRAFGLFQRMLQGYAGPVLVETIPGFHDTRSRLATLESAVAEDQAGRATSVAVEIDLARSRRGYAEVLPPLLSSGALPQRVVHNDAKAANVLIDVASGEALAVIDLDTVMPGTLLYDVGDLIRSIASPTREDEQDLSRIGVRPPLIAALAAGYLGACGAGLTEAERSHFIFAGLLLTYEQGVRFLTDHLAGDRYYRITRPGQNLDRARGQFRLLTSLESERPALEAMVDRTLSVSRT